MNAVEPSRDDYRAQWDAETLAEARTIEKDTERLNRAKMAAEKMAKEQKDKAASMQEVASNRRRARPISGTSPPTGRRSNRKDNGTPANSFNVFQRI